MAVVRGVMDWLGLTAARSTVGLAIGSHEVSMVALHHDRLGRLRLAAIGRQPVYDAAVVDGDVRLVGALADDIAGLAHRLRLRPDTEVVATIEPSTGLLADDDRSGDGCVVAAAARDRLVELVDRAGLRLQRVDPVPAALARLARSAVPGVVALRHAGWTVVTCDGYTEAERGTWPEPGSTAAGTPFLVGPDLNGLRPLDPDLLPIEVPARVRVALDLDRDAISVGAALAGAGLLPLPEIRTVAAAPCDRWTAQPVTVVRRPS